MYNAQLLTALCCLYCQQGKKEKAPGYQGRVPISSPLRERHGQDEERTHEVDRGGFA
nr:MAG TPA: hypothetical protein [Caudoviricetes sp.]